MLLNRPCSVKQLVLMMNLRSFLLLGMVCATSTYAQTSTSDCAGAIELCGGIFTETTAPLGTGSVYEFTGTCNQNNETASLWYTFTVQEAGDLSFVLDPANASDDYDWGLFDITNGGCAGINAQDGTSPEVNCSSYGLIGQNGMTGISTANGGSGTSNGPGDLNGPAFNADLPVQVGQTYALVVMNWSGSQDGYTIDFTQSSASLYDQTPPVPISVVADCTNETLQLTFSESIVTSTVQATDFNITTPSGGTVAVSSVSPDQPTAFAQIGFDLVLPTALQETGMYTLLVTLVSDNVEDPCGNVVVDTTLQFNVVAPLSFTVTTSTACNGAGGGLVAAHTGGTEPVTYTLAGTTLPTGTAEGLAPGAYFLNVVDSIGCQVFQQVTIPDHLLQAQLPQDQDSLSCSQAFITIEGLLVVPEQTVSYAWTAVTESGTNPNFSTSATPQVGQAGTYTVLVTEPISGCTDEASVVIAPTTVPTVDLSSIILPTVISPNGDGKNDEWRPFLQDDPELDITSLFEAYSLTVYNRWGQLMHEAEGAGRRSWNARDAAAGTYYYTVTYRASCGAVIDQERTGSITVLR